MGVVAQKVEIEEAMAKVWEPLKNSTFEGHSSAKNKAMKNIIHMIEKAGGPQSLTSALALALKQKFEARSVFSKTAMEHGEQALKDHIAKLASDIEVLDAENAEVLSSIDTLTKSLQMEEEKLQTAQEASIAAQN